MWSEEKYFISPIFTFLHSPRLRVYKMSSLKSTLRHSLLQVKIRNAQRLYFTSEIKNIISLVWLKGGWFALFAHFYHVGLLTVPVYTGTQCLIFTGREGGNF